MYNIDGLVHFLTVFTNYFNETKKDSDKYEE